MRELVTQEGRVLTLERPEPAAERNFVVVRTRYSAVSPGTELGIRNKSQSVPQSLGYSATGIVEAVGEGVEHVRPGDRVACYGAPYVKHAEKLAVPKHLAVPVPKNVSDEEAAFVGLGAIAIHALRQADLRFGESAAVIGLGILGQLVCRIAHAASCPTVGVDLLPERCGKLREAGIAACDSLERFDAEQPGEAFAGGFDAVLICAGGSNSGLIDLAIDRVRDRGKVVIVGDIEASFSRGAMFAKEAQVLISRAGGPGRYDTCYERDGVDYPVGYVRWTEGRNMAEFVRLLACGRLSVKPLVSHIVPFSDAAEAYRLVERSPRDTLGVLIDYAR